jgi:hypothetical protein
MSQQEKFMLNDGPDIVFAPHIHDHVYGASQERVVQFSLMTFKGAQTAGGVELSKLRDFVRMRFK